MGRKATRSSAPKERNDVILSPKKPVQLPPDSVEDEAEVTTVPTPVVTMPNVKASEASAEQSPTPIATSKPHEFLQNGDGTAVSDGTPVISPLKETSTSNAHKMFDEMPEPENGNTDAAKDEQKKPTWADMFKGNRSPIQGDTLEELACNKASGVFEISVEDIHPVKETRGFTLIGYVAGKYRGRSGIRSCVNGWKVPAKYYIHHSGWIVFGFEDEQSMTTVLQGGPYFICKSSLLLKPIPEYFRFDDEEMSIMPVWVRLPCLPRELWHPRALGKILSFVGNPIQTDKRTATLDFISYARALVEVDASKELVKEVPISLPNGVSFVQTVYYEYLPTYCRKCRCIGHTTAKCSKATDSTGDSGKNLEMNDTAADGKSELKDGKKEETDGEAVADSAGISGEYLDTATNHEEPETDLSKQKSNNGNSVTVGHCRYNPSDSTVSVAREL